MSGKATQFRGDNSDIVRLIDKLAVIVKRHILKVKNHHLWKHFINT